MPDHRARRRFGRTARWAPLSVLAVLAAAAAVAVAVAVVLPADGRLSPRAGSTELGEGSPIGISRTPASWRIDYQVTGFGGGERVVSSERVWVRRPFESRVEVYEGPEPTGRVTALRISAFGTFLTHVEGGEALVVVRPPLPAGGDVRIDATIDDAIADGLVERRERRQVLDRPCQVYRTGASALDEMYEPPAADEFYDICVDSAGLVLEEVLFRSGEVLLRRLAIAVDEEPPLDGVDFEPGEQTVPPDQGGGFLAEMVPGSRAPGPFWELGRLPAGFRHTGRYAVVPAQPDAFSEPSRRGSRISFVTDVLRRGVDLIVVEQGGTLESVEPETTLPDRPTVDLGDLGEGVELLGPSGAALRIELGGGRFVRLEGTVDVDVLIELARGLTAVEGGELQLVDA